MKYEEFIANHSSCLICTKQFNMFEKLGYKHINCSEHFKISFKNDYFDKSKSYLTYYYVLCEEFYICAYKAKGTEQEFAVDIAVRSPRKHLRIKREDINSWLFYDPEKLRKKIDILLLLD